jgi:hypothetical protein
MVRLDRMTTMTNRVAWGLATVLAVALLTGGVNLFSIWQSRLPDE